MAEFLPPEIADAPRKSFTFYCPVPILDAAEDEAKIRDVGLGAVMRLAAYSYFARRLENTQQTDGGAVPGACK